MICYLVRHGKDDETVRGGWSQSPLTEEGLSQAAALADFVERSGLDIRAVFSSDLPRAMQTAEAVAARLGLAVIPRAEFREVNNGELAGMKNELAVQKYPGLYWNTLGWEQQYPGGESPRAFCERICRAWEDFQAGLAEQEGNVLLVTHGGVMQVILAAIKGEAYSNQIPQPKVGYAEMIPLELRDGKAAVRV